MVAPREKGKREEGRGGSGAANYFHSKFQGGVGKRM